MTDNIIKFSKKEKTEKKEPSEELDLELQIKLNQEKKDKVAKERLDRNKSVLKSYDINKKKR